MQGNMKQLCASEVEYVAEVLEMCLEFMEISHVEDMILNKINEAIKILEDV